MGIRLAILVALGLLVAGCLGSTEPAENPSILPPEMVIWETPSATIVGDHYAVGGAEVVLLIHGGSGVRGNYWGDKSLPDYSPARLFNDAGYDVVAIDRPGYGDSRAEATSVDLEAAALDVVADDLRSDYESVHAVGVSMGAFMAGVTQALYESFDSVVAAGWAHGAFSEDARSCSRAGLGHPDGECPEPMVDDFYFPNAEPVIMEEVVAGYQDAPQGTTTSFGVWNGFAWGIHEELTPVQTGPTLYDMTSHVTVPVLVVLGTEDWYLDHDVAVEDCDHYGGPCEVVELPETGHMVFHHKNRVEVVEAVAAWLSGQ